MSVLIVIPVRGGSVGIPRKALRLLGGISPLVRTITTAKQLDADLVVTTDDEAIAQAAAQAGAQVVMEPLRDGTAALDGSVCFATDYMERVKYPEKYDVVVTLQCTSPFTTVETIRNCLAAVGELHTTAITVRDDRGLRWETGLGEIHLATRAPRRVTRQRMMPCWRETGAVFATPRKWVESTSRFAHTVQLIEVTGREAVDLDTPEDWAIAEMYAGATERELLLARVLMDQPRQGEAVILSAWDEEPGEHDARVLAAARWPGAAIYNAAHTYGEARMAIEHHSGVDTIIVTSAYHMPRAFLTFLQVLKDAGLERKVRLWCAPAPSSMAKLSGEWDKIREYQTKGHVARIDEGLTYLDWRDATRWSETYACVA